MSLFVGIDIGIGVSTSASWTAVVALSEQSDRPVFAERYKSEVNNFEKRLGQISEFCHSALETAWKKQRQTISGVLIAEPKMRGATFDHKNKRTGRVTKVTANLRSMFDLAQARGAIVARLEARGIPVYSMVESSMKKAFTGDGRADKETIHYFAQIQWPNIPVRDYDFGDATMVAEILKRRYKVLKQEREAIH